MLYMAGNSACLPVHCLPMDLGMTAMGGALVRVQPVVRGGEYLSVLVEALSGWRCAGNGLLMFSYCCLLWRGQLIAVILPLLLLLRYSILVEVNGRFCAAPFKVWVYCELPDPPILANLCGLRVAISAAERAERTCHGCCWVGDGK